MTNHSQQNFNGKYFTFLVFFPCKIQYFGPKIVKNYQFTWFCSQRSIFKSKLSPKKERSIRKYGKSPNEVSFFERSSTGHPALNQSKQISWWPLGLLLQFSNDLFPILNYAESPVSSSQHIAAAVFQLLCITGGGGNGGLTLRPGVATQRRTITLHMLNVFPGQ